VVKIACLSGENTRAIGVVYENGVPKNGVRVRVSFDYGGAAVAADFISGHDPINPNVLDPQHPGYYQIGISEGATQDGNWWVFIVDDQNRTISDGRWFKTDAIVSGSSCNIGVTDFAK
jgi:hypothetical protein